MCGLPNLADVAPKPSTDVFAIAPSMTTLFTKKGSHPGGLFATFCGELFDPLVVKDSFLRGSPIFSQTNPFASSFCSFLFAKSFSRGGLRAGRKKKDPLPPSPPFTRRIPFALPAAFSASSAVRRATAALRARPRRSLAVGAGGAGRVGQVGGVFHV